MCDMIDQQTGGQSVLDLTSYVFVPGLLCTFQNPSSALPQWSGLGYGLSIDSVPGHDNVVMGGYMLIE